MVTNLYYCKTDPVCPLRILPIHSTIPWEEHGRIFEECQPGIRKIILATNLAEASLTIPDVKHVIDFCLTKHIQAGFLFSVAWPEPEPF